MHLVDSKDGKLKHVKRIVVDGVEIFNFETTLRLEYNMIDRLAADRSALKAVTVEHDDGSASKK